MTAQIISGAELAATIRAGLAEETAKLKESGVEPGLAVILVGDDPASHSYVKGKQKACAEVGIRSFLYTFPASISEEELLAKIRELNGDPAVHGILVQLPLPEHIREWSVIETIAPEKDVDGFHPINVGKMMIGQPAFLPCTPHGVLVMVKSAGIDIAGKHVVVVGRSNIVGKPVGQLFLREHATVTYAHSKTPDLPAVTRQADILIVAVGKARLIGPDHVKPGAVVIDVGVNRLESGKLCGDVDFDAVKEVAGYITPVPKGVGPMTITMLLHNTIEAARQLAVK
ncbi:bifunctional methylenetetrahydrofolate dehydrogenase/methenyltetrahydrofolate cyclohydrolase FolD [Geobacillus sp. FSL K6-0789]|jgi:methylenetetrahydrofolate dehydrogenase (NADP+)/methenyltetrahydrofolate cyclohydrolase|uniref:Bifunctional protein FolD n=1 Tax=Geobacillus stearothermophilus TaxID=1422 RepID=A0A087LFX8_GEOSE|nr:MULTISPECIES: bifunctional methylenetetrahydrofolate dehydrogenase/methenyltetrahydrofolate cyclohydrolase FolD [Geobacillus]AKM19627.1 Bifunctional protein FolD protein [Geobacillus sp. 12AMOR1]AKU25714.1 5,10-methylene-tetrahydrofolate cyclohydrolase [Geobacillus sp. LC300]ASS86513.1 bifunctional methylenetetrahydrofolate dehydrogenase/methenyltetrahydrofolate cyclohydrolase [Geobacillus lituanicus]MED0654078.1 bifunctional methylenetetrahydrofolate dehydrogenase/methenyltetrahydrofolate c